MPCSLIGRIGIFTRPLSPLDLGAEAAVRVSTAGHDVILLNSEQPVWDRIERIRELVTDDERDLLVAGVGCGCTREELAQAG